MGKVFARAKPFMSPGARSQLAHALVTLMGEVSLSEDEIAYRAGRWFAAAMLNDPQSRAYCERNPGLEIIPAKADGVKAAVGTTNTGGGFLVPSELEAAIISRRALSGVFRRDARVRPMGSDLRSFPRRQSGLTTYFVAGNDPLTESQPVFDNVDLNAKKLITFTRLPNELWEDEMVGLGEWWLEEVSAAFADTEDSCGFNGDGSQTYGGIVGITPQLINGSHNAGKITAAAAHDLFTELDSTDLGSVMAALPEQYLQNAKWYASSYAIGNTFARLGMLPAGTTFDAYGRPRPMFSYAGFLIEPTPKLPGAGSQTGKVMLLFGDLRMCSTMGSRTGVVMNLSQHRYLDLDQVAIKGRERFDIVSSELGDGTTAGAMVGLVGA